MKTAHISVSLFLNGVKPFSVNRLLVKNIHNKFNCQLTLLPPDVTKKTDCSSSDESDTAEIFYRQEARRGENA